MMMTALEREIDRLVYKLYDLTPEEIKLVRKAGSDEIAQRRQYGGGA